MPYKLGDIPTSGASESEKCDFMEIQCLLSETKSYSIMEASQAFGFVNDEDSGSLDQDLPFYDTLTLFDIRDMQANNSNYPFVTEGYSVSIKKDVADYIKDVYIFLLLATRNNMQNNRKVEGIDGTALFEHLCALVLKNYFGEERTNSFVFGTGNDAERSFKSKVNLLLRELKEPGYVFYKTDDNTGDEVDDKLDVVAHIPFLDGRKGQFIAFCQCKTGTNWKDKVFQLQPGNFCESHIQPPLNFTPIPVFMVCESFRDNWENLTRKQLFFDRCRIMEYIPEEIVLTENNLLENIRFWNSHILDMYRQS